MGEAGEIPLPERDAASKGDLVDRCARSVMLVSDALRMSLPPASPFFCLNFSSQLVLRDFRWFSVLPPTPCEKCLAFSMISPSDRSCPDCCAFFAQLDRARSMSGNLLLDRLTGDPLLSSGKRYFSFWRRTLDTVLDCALEDKTAYQLGPRPTFARHQTSDQFLPA